jgi:hypothetical protein
MYFLMQWSVPLRTVGVAKLIRLNTCHLWGLWFHSWLDPFLCDRSATPRLWRYRFSLGAVSSILHHKMANSTFWANNVQVDALPQFNTVVESPLLRIPLGME